MVYALAHHESRPFVHLRVFAEPTIPGSSCRTVLVIGLVQRGGLWVLTFPELLPTLTERRLATAMMGCLLQTWLREGRWLLKLELQASNHGLHL